MNEEYLIGAKKRILEFLLLIVIIFFMELLFNLIIFNGFISYFLLEATFVLIISMPILIINKNYLANIYGFIIFALVSVFFIVNLEMYSASSDIFTFKYLTLTGEAAAVMSIDFINLWFIFYLILFIIAYIGGLILINTFFKGGCYNTRKGITLAILCLLILIPARMITYNVIVKDYSNNYLYYKESGQEIVIKSSTIVKRASLKNFGLLNYTYADLQAQFVDVLQFGETSEEEKEYNIETSMTGKAKGYNVLEIMIETGISLLIDENLTPNLYNLREEGITFTNNHSKNKTNISEFIGIAGSVSSTIKNQNTKAPQGLPSVLGDAFGYDTSYFHCNYASFYNRGRTMPQIGFNNSYFVGSDVFNFMNYGKKVKYEAKDLAWRNNFNGRYPFDSDYVTRVKDLMIPEYSDKPFYSFYTTLSMHGPYNYKNSLKDYYKTQYDEIMNLIDRGLYVNPCSDDPITVQEQFIEFEAKAMIFDDALGILINDLKEKGLFDNTLIVLYGDHECYYHVGIDKDLKYYMYNSNSEYYSPEYETFLTFYNPNVISELKNHYNEFKGFSMSNNRLYYNAFSSPYVIVPTILDLLGIKYVKGNYVGRSIFQPMQTSSLVDNVFYSTEIGIVFTDDISSDGENTYWESNGVTNELRDDFYYSVDKILARVSRFDSYYVYGHFNDDNVVNDILGSYSYF